MNALRASLRVTGRDIRRHPWHALAALLFIAIPVAFAGFFLVTESSRSTAHELASTPASVATTVRYFGGRCQQSPDGYIHECTEITENTEESPPQKLLDETLPPGVRTRLTVTIPATLESARASAPTILLQVDPDLDQAPGPGQISLSTSLREQLALSTGDTVDLSAGGRALTLAVTGDTPGFESIVTEPTVVDPAVFRPTRELSGVWTLPETTLSWADVARLNDVGFVVQGEQFSGAPPPAAPGFERHPMGPQYEPFFFLIVLMTLIFAAVITLLLGLLISPVFTVAVGRQKRSYALLSAHGATPRQILAAAAAYGIAAGVVGATLGLVAGVTASLLWWPVRYPDWPLDPPPLGLPALWLYAVAVAGAAGFIPARLASRASPLKGLRDAEAGRSLRWRPWMWVGPALLASAATVLGVSRLAPPLPNFEDLNWGSLTSAAGGLLGFLGVVLCAPTVIWLIARFLRRPLAARLAARDMLRDLPRHASAVAAVAAVVTFSTFIIVQSQAYATRSAEWERQVYRPGVITVQDSPRLEETVEEVSEILGPLTREDVHGLGYNWLTPNNNYFVADPVLSEPCVPGRPCGPDTWVPGPQNLFDAHVVIASPVLLDALGGPRLPSGPAMLVSDGTEVEASTFQLHDEKGEPVGPEVTLRIAPVLPESVSDWMPTREAFEQFEIAPEFLGVVLLAERPVTPSLRDELTAIDAGVRVPGVALRQDPAPRFILAAFVVVVATWVPALSARQQRRRGALLLAIGAPPPFPRDVIAWTGALVTVAGSVLGLVAGHAGALFTSPGTAAHTGVDGWLALLLLVVAPAVSAAIGWAVAPRPTVQSLEEPALPR